MSEPIYTIPPIEYGPTADALPAENEFNWGMLWPGVAALRALTDGAGVAVGGIDTGIDRNHPLLKHCKDAADFTGSRHGPDDRHGHGSHISGSIGASDPRIGVAPGADLYHGKGLGDQGAGSGQAITGAMKWCAARGCEVLSMSLGSPGADPEITGLMRELAQQGIWIIAAAGNSGPNTPDVDWPGRSPHCISVAALNQDLSPANFSSAGAKIDTSGPGVGIWSCRPGGGFQQMSGTSMACPYVAGVLTLYRAALKKAGRPVPKIGELRALLFGDSMDVYTPGDDRRSGPGAISSLLLSLDLAPDPSPVRRP